MKYSALYGGEGDERGTRGGGREVEEERRRKRGGGREEGEWD